MKRIFLTSIFCKNIITIFLLTASVLYSQTTITKVIHPGAKEILPLCSHGLLGLVLQLPEIL